MSAIEAETADGPIEIINVLFALHPNFGAQELVGPLEVLTRALHKSNDPGNTPSCFSQIGASYLLQRRFRLSLHS